MSGLRPRFEGRAALRGVRVLQECSRVDLPAERLPARLADVEAGVDKAAKDLDAEADKAGDKIEKEWDEAKAEAEQEAQ